MEEIKILIMKRRFILIIVNILFPSLKTGLSYQYWRTEQEFSTCPAYVRRLIHNIPPTHAPLLPLPRCC